MMRGVTYVLAIVLIAHTVQSTSKEGKLKAQLKRMLQHEKKIGCSSDPITILTQDEQDLMKDKHNEYRREAPASNMMELGWNDKLANRAQALSEQCDFDHLAAYQDDCSGQGMGQNMYITYGSQYPDITYDQAVTSWNDEKHDYTYVTGKKGTCKDGKMCGHYTQVVWADTTEVGCGAHKCPTATVYEYDAAGNLIPKEVSNAIIVTCNYRSAGNYPRPPFKEGNSCDDCKYNVMDSGYKCADKLCVPCDVNKDGCSCPGCLQADVSSKSACDQWASYCHNPLYMDFMKKECFTSCYCKDPATLPAKCSSKKRNLNDRLLELLAKLEK